MFIHLSVIHKILVVCKEVFKQTRIYKFIKKKKIIDLNFDSLSNMIELRETSFITFISNCNALSFNDMQSGF